MEEVSFLLECVKAGKLSKEQAKDLLFDSSSIPAKESRLQKLKAATVCGGSPHNLPNGAGNCNAQEPLSCKRAELMAKYKAIQKQNREKSLSSSKGKGGKMKSTRNPVLMKISMGGMKFNDIRQCGTRCKELGPITSVSIPPAASYEDIIEKAKQQFFATTDDEQRYEYFLADPQGSKLVNSINGKPWNLAEYIHLHGLYPSKTKIYCVQRDKDQYPLEDHVMQGEKDDQENPVMSEKKDNSKEVSIIQVCNEEVVEISNETKSDRDPYLLSGSVITLGRRLGEGGFGTVYLSNLNGTLVAVKQLKLEKFADVDHMNEIRALSALHHPNIVLFMGYTCNDKCIQIVTNYVHGNDLYHLLFKEKKQFDLNDKGAIAEQIAQALAYMHSLNPPVIHRDVKPPNVLVEKGTLHVYLTDMGMAKIKLSCATMTQVQCVGTVYYAAPETFEGAVGKPSDVWALGMVLLELYGQRQAWGDVRHQNQLMMKLMTKELPALNHLDQCRQQICKACLDFQPKNRKSVIEVLELIRSTL